MQLPRLFGISGDATFHDIVIIELFAMFVPDIQESGHRWGAVNSVPCKHQPDRASVVFDISVGSSGFVGENCRIGKLLNYNCNYPNWPEAPRRLLPSQVPDRSDALEIIIEETH
jgi:hypothetical protein